MINLELCNPFGNINSVKTHWSLVSFEIIIANSKNDVLFQAKAEKKNCLKWNIIICLNIFMRSFLADASNLNLCIAFVMIIFMNSRVLKFN